MTFFTKEGDHFIKHKETNQQQLFGRFRIIDTLKEIGLPVSIRDIIIKIIFAKDILHSFVKKNARKHKVFDVSSGRKFFSERLSRPIEVLPGER